ncbi:MAG: 30S ribosomal protein S16 [Candidatus Moranbacteria bacterium]|nr:30S ribosomal protein S16 [Candidatus Moranbacteria bacterium]
MLKIRLTRRGKKNNAFFRIVVAEHTSPIKGGFLEVLGFLNPHTKEKSFKADRIEYWIGKGAQCSDTVHNLLVSNSVISGSKRAVKLKKKPAEEVKAESASSADKEAKPEDKEVKAEEVAEAKPSASAEATADKEEKEEEKEEVKESEAAKSEPEEEVKKESEEKK